MADSSSASESNDHLVLTSADFGRAYLTDAWAARFVVRLFAEFTVLFIGYSLNDPVLRYMMDAFAAEEWTSRSGLRRAAAYIFIGYSGRHPPDRQQYLDRGLEPIFYKQERKHLRLKQTIMGWAAAREDFLLSAHAIIERSGSVRPQALDPRDTENLLWAVVGRPQDEGHGAWSFAKLYPIPPIDWVFEIERHENMKREKWIEASRAATTNEQPSPPEPARHLLLLAPMQDQGHNSGLTQTAAALIPWIGLHLESVELVDWVIDKMKQGRRLHGLLRREIRNQLVKKPVLPGFATFWRIVSAEGPWNRSDLSGQASRAFVPQSSGAVHEAWLRQEFLALLRPYLSLSKASIRQWRMATETDGTEVEPIGQSIGMIADATVHLAGHDGLTLALQAVDGLPDPDGFLAELASHLTHMLEQALDLYAIVGRASDKWDLSAIDRPSVRPHPQNHRFRDWTVLFDLLWRAWRKIDATSVTHSRSLVQQWREIPYLAFRRLAIAAVTESAHFTVAEKLEVLIRA